MNVLLTFDNNYTQHACVATTSFCHNNPGRHNFYIISDNISDNDQEKMAKLVKSYKGNIEFFFIKKEEITDFPIGEKTANSYVSLATYFRLFMFDVLPISINKILYLDCDIIVNCSLEKLWNYNSDSCILAIEDNITYTKNNCKRLQYNEMYSYFNAGMLLINLQEARFFLNIKIASEYIRTHKIIYHDQDVLNGIFHDKKTFVDVKYNLLDIYLVKNAPIPNRYKDQISDAIKNPYIVHFSGPLKPWHKECKNPYKHLYYKYLKMTPGRDYKPVYKYNTFKERALFLAKLFVKYILEKLHIKYYSFIDIKKI